MKTRQAVIELVVAGKFVALLLACAMFAPICLQAQLTGSPAVYNSGVAYSPAYVDASVFPGSNFCIVLNNALAALASTTNYPGDAGVVDARGVNPSSVSYTCGSGTSGNPWNNITVPATVLLPAGTIKTLTTWTLPSGTRLIGEGETDPNLMTPRTRIQAQPTFTTGASLIQMGASSGCTGVSVEDLALDGYGLSVNGISNEYCGQQSYVNHVTMYQITGIGLNVYSGAADSGPYANITFDSGAAEITSSTECANIAARTKGIHGMLCTTGIIASPTNGIYLASGASQNTIEDVRVAGFVNGIYVGASGVVLRNILGDVGPKPGSPSQVVSVVEIGTGTTNVVLIGISNTCSSNQISTCDATNNLTITDSATGANLYVQTDPYVAMYIF